MEVIQSNYNDDDDNLYINRIIMIPERDGFNHFYKIVSHTTKMFCVRKILAETNLYNTIYDEITNEESKIYEAKITDEFENNKIKKIRKTSINKYPVIYCKIVQYEV